MRNKQNLLRELYIRGYRKALNERRVASGHLAQIVYTNLCTYASTVHDPLKLWNNLHSGDWFKRAKGLDKQLKAWYEAEADATSKYTPMEEVEIGVRKFIKTFHDTLNEAAPENEFEDLIGTLCYDIYGNIANVNNDLDMWKDSEKHYNW